MPLVGNGTHGRRVNIPYKFKCDAKGCEKEATYRIQYMVESDFEQHWIHVCDDHAKLNPESIERKEIQ